MASASWYSINFSCSVSDSDALKEAQADEKIAEGTLVELDDIVVKMHK